MSLYSSAFGSFALALLAQPAAAQVQLGRQLFFKDWATACDNTLSCEAVALSSESFPDADVVMIVKRESGAKGQLTVGIAGSESKSDRYRIVIDGRVADSGSLGKGQYPVSLTGPDALKLVRAVARGNRLELRDGEGALLGALSLAGSAAAFRHIDQMQKRANTPSALVATGRKSLRPMSAPMPVISAQRIGNQDAIPDATALVKLVENSDCATERFGVTEDTAYSLGRHGGKARALVLISCGSGAYNFLPHPSSEPAVMARIGPLNRPVSIMAATDRLQRVAYACWSMRVGIPKLNS
jgi:Protein of unknown function (DUF1176)